jgi:hypothetical protein
MVAFSLFDRITKEGTLSEPKGVPDPTFALPSTVNWMRALRVLVDDAAISFQTARKFYSGTGKRAFSRNEENTIFEQLLFAVHQLSALDPEFGFVQSGCCKGRHSDVVLRRLRRRLCNGHGARRFVPG